MSIIELKVDQAVAVIKLNNGENRFNPQFLQKLAQILDDVKSNRQISSAVLVSTDDKYWSLGVELDWFYNCFKEKNQSEVVDFFTVLDRIFKTLLLYPVPVIAAVNGHSYAAGAVLASACDFRFMRGDRGFYCIPEVDLDIQLSPGTVAMLKQKYSSPVAYSLMLSGKRITAAEMERLHLIEKQCESNSQTLEEALRFARTFDKKRKTFAEMKQIVNGPLIKAMEDLNPDFYKQQFGV